MNLIVPILGLALLLASPAKAGWPQALAAPPAVQQMQLSPSGDNLAQLRRSGTGWALFAGPGPGLARKVYETEAAMIQGVSWISEQRLVLTLRKPGGAPWLLAVNLDGSQIRQLTPDHWAGDTRRGAGIIDMLVSDSAAILLGLDDDIPWAPQVHRLDVFSGEKTLVAGNSGSTYSWMSDRLGQIRLRSDYTLLGDGIRYSHYWRPAPGASWELLAAYPLGQPGITPLMFDLDNRSLIVSSDLHTDSRGLYRYDPESRRITSSILQVPGADLSQLRFSGISRQPAMVAFNTLMPQQNFLLPSWRYWDQQLRRRLPDTHNRILSLGAQERQAIVLAYSDVQPGHYYHFDTASGSLSSLDSQLPGLEQERFAATRGISFTSRDGLNLNAYFTAPQADSGPWPLLVYVHGGPWARDTWGFDPMVQALAAEGIAVLKVNFRGSRGMGRKLLLAGREQWGRRMQDDLLDALDWTVKRGWVDSSRVCIMGHSYGGYAALMGVLRDADRFVCAVANAAVTDLDSHIAGYRQNGNRQAYGEWRYMVGRGRHLQRISPVGMAATLQRPLLLSHGSLDHTVLPQQSLRFIAAAGEAASYIQWLPLVGEGHHLLGTEARLNYFRRSVEFIRRHLLDRAQERLN